MANKEIVFNREDLYERVWMKPMSRLAKEFGISDVALAKICKKLNVPKPPRGYWAKLEFKKKVHRQPLPKLSPDRQNEFVHYDNARNEYEVDVDPEIVEVIRKERAIIISDTLDNPHRLVKDTFSILSKTKASENGLLYSDRRGCLSVNVSPSSLDRALRILDAMIKGFEAEGFKVFIDSDEKTCSYVSIYGEKLKFHLTEDYRWAERVPTDGKKTDKPANSFWNARQYDYCLTGNLSLKIDESWGYGRRKTWSDSKTGRLEDKIGNFISGAILLAHVLKLERQMREEASRKQEEERRKAEDSEQRRREEESRIQALEQQAAFWAKSEQLRAFVQAVERAVTRKNMSESARKGYESWMIWARNHADHIDPITLTFLKENDE